MLFSFQNDHQNPGPWPQAKRSARCQKESSSLPPKMDDYVLPLSWKRECYEVKIIFLKNCVGSKQTHLFTRIWSRVRTRSTLLSIAHPSPKSFSNSSSSQLGYGSQTKVTNPYYDHRQPINSLKLIPYKGKLKITAITQYPNHPRKRW